MPRKPSMTSPIPSLFSLTTMTAKSMNWCLFPADEAKALLEIPEVEVEEAVAKLGQLLLPPPQ
jgi:hypothetical protein